MHEIYVDLNLNVDSDPSESNEYRCPIKVFLPTMHVAAGLRVVLAIVEAPRNEPWAFKTNDVS